MTALKCRAQNPAECNDPQCPERRAINHAYGKAIANNSFNDYAKARQMDSRRTTPSPANLTHLRPRTQAAPTVRRAPYSGQRVTPANETLYHKELGFPTNFRAPQVVVPLVYGNHAIKESMMDRYGTVDIPDELDTSKFDMIELGVVDGKKVSKILYRGKMNDDLDMCIVVVPRGKGQPWFVKTVWINERTDRHRTLDTSKYQRPAA